MNTKVSRISSNVYEVQDSKGTVLATFPNREAARNYTEALRSSKGLASNIDKLCIGKDFLPSLVIEDMKNFSANVKGDPNFPSPETLELLSNVSKMVEKMKTALAEEFEKHRGALNTRSFGI